MAISLRKRERLSAFLGALPSAAAVKLFSALEADRASGNAGDHNGLPHDAIMADLRLQLAEHGALPRTRPKSAKRTFFTPLEDYFISIRIGKKRQAQIARTSLDPIWRLMMTDPALTEAALAAAALDDVYARAPDSDDAGLVRSLYVAAEAGLGRLCARAHDNPALRDGLVAELGGENVYADMEEVRYLLEGVDALAKLRVLAPSHAPSLNDEQIYELRQLFLSVYEQSPFLGGHLLLALKGRLDAPWRALGVYYHLAKSADERLLGARDVVMVLPESLFEDLEALAVALERAGGEPLDTQTARARLGYFADYAGGLTRQASRVGDNVFVNRIEACREIAVEAHARFIEQALAAFRAAMPVRHAGASSRLAAPRPDFSNALALDLVDDARRGAALIAAAPEDARRLGADPAFAQSAADDAVQKARVYANDLVAEIRAAEGDGRAAARALLEQTLSVVEALLNSDDIGLIRDRAAAAAVTV